jgi:hypothetical protein
VKIKEATEEDLSVISEWFSNRTEAINWGGPSIPFPLDLGELKLAISWDEADSYAFINELGHVIGFEIHDYPEEREHIGGCLFMIKKT